MSELTAFIGVGNMGNPMAHNLVKAGKKVKVFDISKNMIEKAKEKKLDVVENLDDLITNEVTTVITMLPEGKNSKEVYLGDKGIINKVSNNCLLIDCSTIDIQTSIEIGKKATEKWAKGLVANMARDSKGNDRAQILAVAAGEADLAVANTYYLALMLSGKKGAEQQAAAKKVLPFFPNQGDRGTHMNISGGGVLKNAPNPENAKKLLEFLLTKEAQEHIVNNTFEYPMIDGVEPHDLVKQMGLGFKQDLNTKVVNYGKNQAIALECMLAAKWK